MPEARDKPSLVSTLQMQSREDEVNSRLTSGYHSLATASVFSVCGAVYLPCGPAGVCSVPVPGP